MTTITIFLHHSHDPEIVYETLTDYPDLTIDLNSDPRQTPITGPLYSIVSLLLDYYHWEHDDVLTNHPQITQADIDSYISA